MAGKDIKSVKPLSTNPWRFPFGTDGDGPEGFPLNVRTSQMRVPYFRAFQNSLVALFVYTETLNNSQVAVKHTCIKRDKAKKYWGETTLSPQYLEKYWGNSPHCPYRVGAYVSVSLFVTRW